jgi:hypothetical protein
LEACEVVHRVIMHFIGVPASLMKTKISLHPCNPCSEPLFYTALYRKTLSVTPRN